MPYKQPDKIRSNYSTKCQRNAKIVRYYRKQCVSIKKFRNKLETFWTFVIANILEKLPITIKLQITRKLGKENWNIEQFLSAINQEILARENFEYLKQNSFDSKDKNKNFTTSSLHTQAKVIVTNAEL